MERKQQSNEQILVEQVSAEPVREERPSRRLRLVTLEERVAPNAIWGE